MQIAIHNFKMINKIQTKAIISLMSINYNNNNNYYNNNKRMI